MAISIPKHVLWLALGYVATIGGGAAATYFLYGEYHAARDEQHATETQIGLADVKIKRIPDLETDVICLRENLSEVVKILPSTKEVNQFVGKLNDFGRESGVTIRSLSDQKDRSKGKGQDAFDKVIYKLELTANLSQFLAFLSLCEGYERFVRVSTFDIDAGDWADDLAREDVRHDIKINLETFSYRGNEGAQPMKIVNYEKRREQLRDEIVLRRAEIRVEHYDYVANPLRRDPLVDPRHRVTDDSDGGLPFAEQKALVDSLVDGATELVALEKSVKSDENNFIRRLEIENEIDTRLDELKTLYDQSVAQNLVTDVSLRRRIERDVMPVMKDLLARDPGTSAAATLDDLRRFSSDMKSMLAQGDYKGVMSKHAIIKGRVDPRTLSPESAAVLHDIEGLSHYAETALDFEKKEIRITGAVVQDEGSVVVVNGQVLREGDMLEDGLLVHKIASDRIEFSFRGVVLARAR